MTAVITQIIVIAIAALVGIWLIKNIRIGYYLIALQAFLAIAGSLYFSNFWDPVYEYVTGTWFENDNKLDPCQLCWWARILMYPLFPLALIGAAKKSRDFLLWIIPASAIGIGLEIFHYTLQKVAFENPFGCTASNPCNALKVDYFDFITIPYLCLTAFIVIFVWSIVTYIRTK